MDEGSNGEERDKGFLNKVYNRIRRVSYAVFDFLSGGVLSKKDDKISKLEKIIDDYRKREIKLSGILTRINNAHTKERVELIKKMGLKEVENERLVVELSNARNKIAGLEEGLIEIKGTLALTQNELEKARNAYAKVQAIVDANKELEGAMSDLNDYYSKIGIEGTELGKNALNIIRAQKAFVREAYKKIEETKKKMGVLGKAYVRLADEKAIIVLDEKNRIEAISLAAERMIGKEMTGKDISYFSNELSLTINRVVPTYENEFSMTLNSIKNLKDVRAKVILERYFDQYVGAFITIEPKTWFQRMPRSDKVYILIAQKVFDNGIELTDMVNATVRPDYGRKQIVMDLRATMEISDDIVRRINGLTQSRYFRNKLKMVVNNKNVYDKLIRYSIPKELIINALETDLNGEVEPVVRLA